MQKLIIMMNSYNNSSAQLLLLLTFPFFPLFTILFCVLIILNNNDNQGNLIRLLIFLISVYLGLINTTKIYESDLVNYVSIYLDAGKYNIWDYAFIKGKEPVFFIYNYIFYYITGGNLKIYLFGTTFIEYMFYLNAIFIFLNSKTSMKNPVISGIIIGAFFPQIFSLSLHLIRQFLATAIMIYVIVKKICDNKTYTLLAISAIFIHSTTLFFIPFLYLKVFTRELRTKNLLLFFITVIIIALVFPLLSKLLVSSFGNNSLTYIFARSISNKGHDIGQIPYLGFGIMLILLFFYIKNTYLNAKRNIKESRKLSSILNIVLFLILFIIANLNNSEISVRFFFFIYFLFPIIFPFILIKNGNIKIVLRRTINIFLFFFFFYKIEFGTWHYKSISTILFGNLLSILL